MNVLLSAFACDSKMGSEPYVGWNWLKITSSMSRHVTLLTRKHHEESLLESTKKFSNISIVAFDFFGCSDLDHRSKWMKIYYVIWQFLAFFYAFSLSRKEKFDFVMHSTYNVVDFPGFLWLLPKTPFVWGPVGGGQIPPEWSKVLYGKKWFRQRVRALMKSLVRLNPFIYAALRKSSLVLVANESTLKLLPKVFRKKYSLMLETAVDDKLLPIFNHKVLDLHQDFHILWVGQLEHRKALPIILDALVEVRESQPDIFCKIFLTVVGSGPEEKNLLEFTQKHKLSKHVNFVGKIDFSQVIEFYRGADLFVFTSVQDTSGNVVLEALSHGIPILALNHQGVKEMVNETCAFLVPPLSYIDVVNDFAKNIIRVYKDPLARENIGRLGLKHLKEKHTWKSREIEFKRLINEILGPSKSVLLCKNIQD